MTLSQAEKTVATYEKLALQIAGRIAERAKTKITLAPDKIAKLEKGLGSPEAVTDFLTQMPKAPGAEAILDALPSPEKLGALIKALGGKISVLATVAEKGCKGDPQVLAKLADQFEKDPKPLTDLLSEGGLADNPTVLAAILQEGCNGDPAALAAVCTTFKDKADRESLAATLTAGGLGLAPEAAGALCGGDGAALKRLAKDLGKPDELAALNTLLAKGGLDGSASGRPGLLADVIGKGLGGDPKRLIDLHDAFGKAAPEEGLAAMSQMLGGLDGTDGRAGERLARLNKRFGAATDSKLAAEKLRDPFMKSITGMGRAAASLDLVGDPAATLAQAAAKRPAPDPARQTAQLAAGLDGATAAGLLAQGLTDPTERTAAKAAGAALAITQDRTAALEKATPGAPDPAQTKATLAALQKVTEATAELSDQPLGGDLKDLTALDKLCATLMEELAEEPDPATRAKAVLALKAASKAIATSLARRAAGLAQKAGPATEALAKLTELQTLRKGASEAEVAGLKALGDAAGRATGLAAAASEAPADLAKRAKADVDKLEDGAQIEAAKTRNATATTATQAALAMAARLKAAPPPVPPALLEAATKAAETAVEAARAAPDEAQAQAAMVAAKAVCDAVAQVCKAAASLSELALAQANPAGAKALAQASTCDRAREIAGKVTGGAAVVKALDTASAATREAALALAETARLKADPTLGDGARDAARRAALGTGQGAPDPAEVTKAEKAADALALDAKTKAETAAQTLKTTAATDAAAFEALIEKARDAARLALRLGALAVDDTARTSTLAAAEKALTEVSAAAGRLSSAQLSVVATKLGTQRDQAMVAMRAKRDSAGTNKAAAGKAFDATKATIADTAQVLVADLLLTNGDVQAARDDATAKALAAALPGAGSGEEVAALKAARLANQKLALALQGKFTTACGAVPAFTGNDQGGADASKKLAAAAVPAKMRAAIAASDALAGANARWRESAFALITFLERKIKTLTGDPARLTELSARETDLIEARAILVTIRDQAALHCATAPPMLAVMEASRKWTGWMNINYTDETTKQLQDSHAFMASAGTEATRGVDPSKGEKGFAGVPRESLIQLAAGFDSDPYAGADLQDQPLADGEKAQVDMKHVCGRHVTQSYNFGEENDSGPKPDDHKAGLLLMGKYMGRVNSATPAEALLIGSAKENKVNSLLPDTVDKSNLKAVAKEAMEKIKTKYKPMTLKAKVWSTADLGKSSPRGWLQEDVEIKGPPPCKVTVGLEMNAPTEDTKVRMMYAAGGVTPTMVDMLTIGRALGL